MKQKFQFNRKGCLIPVLIVAAAAFVGLYLSATAFPGFGAQGAEFLRNIIGDQATAQLEMFIFQVQDSIHQVEYGLGVAHAAAPWQVASATPTLRSSATLADTPVPLTATPVPTLFTPTQEFTPTPLPPTATPTATPWSPAPASATGNLEGEGLWSPYISSASGQVLAFRTFLQPDPKRPYTLVAIVAFDLTKTRLGFVLGVDEPKIKGTPVANKRSGTIPPDDFQAGVLLATFSGGFKGEHGAYGAMSNGVIALPPRSGLATVAMYKNGDIKIGEWGKDISPSDEIQSWRQNCSLIIQNGKINPLVYDNSSEFWGANLNGATVTWRSGIGLSPDGKTLYYFAGPSMTAEVLSQAMLAAGVQSGMQLDINNYWVHFVAIRPDGAKLVPDPLFPDDMKFDPDRFLKPYSRDFFYMAAKVP